jgi:hypothetical protein
MSFIILALAILFALLAHDLVGSLQLSKPVNIVILILLLIIIWLMGTGGLGVPVLK